MEFIFSILNHNNVRATFFCLGWIAKSYPKLIKEIVARGYEIGSHSTLHQLIYEQSMSTFKSDLDSSIKILEDLSGEPVLYYRAPGFSLTEETKWVFEVLSAHDIQIDCSIFPSGRAHGGFKSFGQASPSIVSYNGIQIKELPINSIDFCHINTIFSGGGYFRILPYSIIRYLTKESNYVMTYFHPRDFDQNQPLIPGLTFGRRFKSYVGLKRSKDKLANYLSDFEWVDVGGADSRIDWERVPIITL